MKDFCIIGSGIAGSTIANLLAKKYSVEIFDKARGPGGRTSNRRYEKNLSFDHGLQYFSPKSDSFNKFIINLEKKKILRKWDGFHLDFFLKKGKNLPKYIGEKGNNDICKYLIKNININYNSKVTKIKYVSNFWTITLNNNECVYFKYLIVTCPFPQSKELTSKYSKKPLSRISVKMQPNVTVMAVYKNYRVLPVSSIKFNNQFISWASQENTKARFKSNKVLWTIQCSKFFSQKIINLIKKKRNKYLSIVLREFQNLTGYKIKNIIFKNIHGWKYSSNVSKTPLQCIWNSKYKLGFCADWFNGPNAEHAWLSAHSLYNRIKKNPPL